jgi:hypothetical protein
MDGLDDMEHLGTSRPTGIRSPDCPARSQLLCRGADKSLARPGRKHVTATEDFEFHISYLLS